jgi:hypothetical protein
MSNSGYTIDPNDAAVNAILGGNPGSTATVGAAPTGDVPAGAPQATAGTGFLATLNALPTTTKVVGVALLAGLLGLGLYSSMLGDAPKGGR